MNALMLPPQYLPWKQAYIQDEHHDKWHISSCHEWAWEKPKDTYIMYQTYILMQQMESLNFHVCVCK